MKVKYIEDDLQCNIINWVMTIGKNNYKYLDYIFHVPNGGYRHVVEVCKFKKMGVTSGVPDLILLVSNPEFHGLLIECKVGNNKLSTNQYRFLKKHANEGFCVACIKSLDEFINVIDNYYSGNEIDWSSNLERCYK